MLEEIDNWQNFKHIRLRLTYEVQTSKCLNMSGAIKPATGYFSDVCVLKILPLMNAILEYATINSNYI